MKLIKPYNSLLSIILIFTITLTLFSFDAVADETSSDYKYVKEVLWDIDFTDEIIDTSNSPVVTLCDASGNILKSSAGDIFSCHTGTSGKSTISIIDGALCLNPQSTTDEVQTNNFCSTISGGEAVFSYKVKVDDYDSQKYVFRLVYIASDGKTYWSPYLNINKGGSFSSISGTKFSVSSGTDSATITKSSTYTCKSGTWYMVEARINFDRNTFSYRVNDTEIGAGTLGKTILRTERVSIMPKTGANSKLYLDDIYVYEATSEGSADMSIYIDGVQTERMCSGVLEADAVIAGDYAPCDVIFALFDGNELTGLKWIENIMKSGETYAHIPKVNFGEVDETMKLKMMLLDSDNITKPKNKVIYADKIGKSTRMLDTETLLTIFQNDDEMKELLLSNIGYHPDSGVLTQDGKKIGTNLKGIDRDNAIWMNTIPTPDGYILSEDSASSDSYTHSQNNVDMTVSKVTPSSTYCRVDKSIANSSIIYHGMSDDARYSNSEVTFFFDIPTDHENALIYLNFTLATNAPGRSYAKWYCDGMGLDWIADANSILLSESSEDLITMELDSRSTSLGVGEVAILRMYKNGVLDSVKTYTTYPSTIGFSLAAYKTPTINVSNIEYGLKTSELMVPAALFTHLGLSVSDDGETAVIDGNRFSAGISTTVADGETITMNASPLVVDGMVYVPLADVASIYGYKLYRTSSGKNDGAVVLYKSDFIPPDNIQALNYYLLYERPNISKILTDYSESVSYENHPRVIMNQEDFDRVKNASDTYTKSMKKRLLEVAETYLKADTLIYELRDGVRLWFVSCDFMDRVMTLAFAYNITGDSRYLNKCIAEMDSIASFETWHPEHNLDVGGLAVGFGLGYDWLYNSLTAEQIVRYERAVYDLCYKEYYGGFTGTSSLMEAAMKKTGNHNPVMNSGVTICALAFMDVMPEISAYLLSNSLLSAEFALPNFWPDGSWFEGVGYGAMNLEYMSLQFSALHSVLGTSYGLDASEGMDKATQFLINMQCPTGAFAFYDGGSVATQWAPGALWLSEHFGYPDVTAHWAQSYNYWGTGRDLVAALMHFDHHSATASINLEKDVYYSENAIVTARDTWTSDTPTFFGAKGGRAADDHGHLDMGTFAFYSDGVRWLHDWSAEDYNVPGYWSGATADGARWKYFRTRAEAHNCLVINPDEYAEYDPTVMVKFTDYQSDDDSVISVLDMTEAHNGKASSAKRGYFLTDNRRSLVVRDEVSVTESSEIYFFLQTEHNVSVSGNTVTLTDRNGTGKTLTIDFACDADFSISKGIPEPLETSPHPDGLEANDGTRIILKATASSSVNITAKFTPSGVSGSSVNDYHIPITRWSINN